MAVVAVLRRYGLACGLWLVVGAGCGPIVQTGVDEGGSSETSLGDDGGATLTSTSSTTDDPSTGSTADPGSGESTEDSGPGVTCSSPWPNVTMLACAKVTGRGALAVTGLSVFYDSEDTIFAVSALSPMEPLELVGGATDVAQLYAHQPYLYWASFSGGEIGRINIPTHSVETVSGFNKPNSITADETHAYVAEYQPDGSVLSVDLGARTKTPLYSDLDYPGSIVRDADTLFFATSTNDGNTPTPIWEGSTSGAMPTPLYSDIGAVEEVILDAGVLYVARYFFDASSIERTPLDAPGETVVLAAIERHPLGIGVTDERVYWTEFSSDEFGNEAALKSVPKEGGEIIEHLTYDDMLYDVVVTTTDTVIFRTTQGVARLDE